MPSRPFPVAVLLLLLLGCATPAERFATRATMMGFGREVMESDSFTHLVLRRGSPAPDRLLHVYIDGDGSPEIAGVPAPDPTPREPLVLELMARDATASAYVGRPCYHGLVTPACRGEVWTSARYSDVVVASLVTAVRRIVQRDDVRRVVWIGYSGGGSLARLAAPRLAETVAVVTIGANLSLARWTSTRGFEPLDGSLDPASAPALAPDVVERHYVGSRDRVVPPSVVTAGAPPSTVVVVDSYDHVCCWTERWPAMLAELDAAVAGRASR